MAVKKKSVLISENTDSLGALIRRLRNSLGMKQKDFAAMFGVTQPAIFNWESDKDVPGHKHLAKMAELTRDEETRSILLGAIGISQLVPPTPEQHEPDRARGKVRAIPMLKDAIAAGEPRAVRDKAILKFIDLPVEWVTQPGELYCVRVSGDSMYPIVRDGAWAVINTSQKDPKKLEAHMVAVRAGEGVTIKWLRKDGDIYMLVPQHVSEDFPVIVLRPEGDFSIVGEVVGWFTVPPPPKRKR